MKHLHKKSKEVCIKTKSLLAASLPAISQVTQPQHVHPEMQPYKLINGYFILDRATCTLYLSFHIEFMFDKEFNLCFGED